MLEAGREVTFCDSPEKHRKHPRTTNPIESRFAYLRLRTDAARRFRKVNNAVAVFRMRLLVVEKKLCILTAANMLKDVCYSVRSHDGVKISTEDEEVAA